MARWNYKVYKHTAPSGKVYIGITCQDCKKRWNYGYGYKSNKYFFSAILKYGWENFKHEILFTDLSKEEAAQKEIELIKEYKSTLPEYGYNLSMGGECGAAGVIRSEETKKQAAETRKNKKLNGGKSYALEEILNHLDDIEKWARDGANEADIARNFGISRVTFWKYKNDNINIFNAIKKGRMNLVDDLKGALTKKALGFTYKERKTYIKEVGKQKAKVIEEYEKYAQPDTGAIHLLLKNLDESWRNDDKATVDLKREKLELDRQKAENDNW